MSDSPRLLLGEPVAKAIHAETERRVAALKSAGITPCLATVLVGENAASLAYIRMKQRAAERIGIAAKEVLLPESTDTAALVDAIEDLNQDPSVHGILLQHPSPPHIDEAAAFDAILPEKDVDGTGSASFGWTALGGAGFPSCTPQAILSILDHYEIEIEGKTAVVVGRSRILGRPVAELLINRHATVTVCHSRTRDLPDQVRRADIVVAAVGQPRFIYGTWIKSGAVVIDAGYNKGNIGDVHFETCSRNAGAITPVPGGVGPVTIATLLKHTVQAAEAAAQAPDTRGIHSGSLPISAKRSR